MREPVEKLTEDQGKQGKIQGGQWGDCLMKEKGEGDNRATCNKNVFKNSQKDLLSITSSLE